MQSRLTLRRTRETWQQEIDGVGKRHGNGSLSDEHLRLDRWLWFARFFKSRTIAAGLCQSGKLRLSGQTVRKANQQVRAGDVVTFPQGNHIRVIKVLELGTRRGPASEARLLYEDLDPPDSENRLPAKRTPPVAQRTIRESTRAGTIRVTATPR